MAFSKLGDTVLEPHSFAHTTGMTFRGMTITETTGGYNVVLRAYTKSGTAVYAMTTETDYLEGLRRLLWAVSGAGGSELWRKDKFYNGG